MTTAESVTATRSRPSKSAPAATRRSARRAKGNDGGDGGDDDDSNNNNENNKPDKGGHGGGDGGGDGPNNDNNFNPRADNIVQWSRLYFDTSEEVECLDEDSLVVGAADTGGDRAKRHPDGSSLGAFVGLSRRALSAVFY